MSPPSSHQDVFTYEGINNWEVQGVNGMMKGGRKSFVLLICINISLV